MIRALLAGLVVAFLAIAASAPRSTPSPTLTYCYSNEIGLGIPCRDFDAITGRQWDI